MKEFVGDESFDDTFQMDNGKYILVNADKMTGEELVSTLFPNLDLEHPDESKETKQFARDVMGGYRDENEVNQGFFTGWMNQYNNSKNAKTADLD